MTISWMPVLPLWAIAFISFALLALLVHGSLVLARKRLPRRWIVVLAILRVAIVLVFAVCMLQPMISFHRTVQEGPPVFVLLDTSKSMGLKVSSAMPRDVMQLMSLYPQPMKRQPSVEYLPVRRHADDQIEGRRIRDASVT